MSNAIIRPGATFPVASGAAGTGARRAFVADATNRGSVKLPAATPELTFVGIATENVSGANNVSLQFDGLALAESDGSAVINPGDDMILAGALGRFRSKALVTGSATLYEVVGKCVSDGQIAAVAGSTFTILLNPYKLSAA